MTLRMADGPVENLPHGLDAYAGYVNDSGIGETWDEVKLIPAPYHLSITTDGSEAMCADVESGAMNAWKGYDYGYCAVSNVNELIKDYGRPRKLWTAHRDPELGAHICSPHCWPGLVTTADGTQWTDHGGAWDESLLAGDFFAPPDPPPITKDATMLLPVYTLPNNSDVVIQVGYGTNPWVYAKVRAGTDEWSQAKNKPLVQVVTGSVPVARIISGQLQIFCEQASDVHVIVFATNDGVTWGQQEMS